MHDLVEAVGVEGREEHHHAALARRAPGLRLRGRQPPGELHPELGASHLGGVHGARDRQHHRGVLHSLLQGLLTPATRIGKHPVAPLDAVELGQVLGARDHGLEELSSLARTPQLAQQHAVAGLGQAPVVARGLLPVRQLEVGPHGPAEVLCRAGNGAGGGVLDSCALAGRGHLSRIDGGRSRRAVLSLRGGHTLEHARPRGAGDRQGEERKEAGEGLHDAA